MAGPQVHPFLMFQGKGEEAINFYASLFPGAKILDIARFGPDNPIAMKASFSIGGQTILCSDSNVKHDFSFTGAFSFFVDCESESQIDHLYSQLSAGGATPMPLDNYGFSRKFAWVNDRFGVSWQLNLL